LARIRTIKPDFWTDENVVECSPLARLLFIGLWNFADDEGRMVYSPVRVKLQILPADNCDVPKLIEELAARRMVLIYQVDSVSYLCIPNFPRHQKIDKRAASKLPEPPRLPPNPPESPRIPPTEGKGMEGNGIEKSIVGQKPDASPQKAELRGKAKELLAFLNAKAGRSFEEVAANLDRIEARLKEGADFHDCKSIIAKKCNEWGADEKMADYLRPATLFNREKFWQYHGQLAAQ
jgi:uncharacterized phage protein (TIGR02220 family)